MGGGEASAPHALRRDGGSADEILFGRECDCGGGADRVQHGERRAHPFHPLPETFGISVLRGRLKICRRPFHPRLDRDDVLRLDLCRARGTLYFLKFYIIEFQSEILQHFYEKQLLIQQLNS